MSACKPLRMHVIATTGFRLDATVSRIVAEAENGSFCLLPRHRDFAAAIVPGVLEYVTDDGAERYLAVDEGLLTKADTDVFVCSRHAVASDDLSLLERVVAEEFAVLDARERAARTAVARLEADFARQFLSLREERHV